MKHIYRLNNTIQEYAWGSRTDIAELMGKPSPTDSPQAELWMGAHPKAPSMVNIDDNWLSPEALIDDNPPDILGRKTAADFSNKLPYLFKVLAAARPAVDVPSPRLKCAAGSSGF